MMLSEHFLRKRGPALIIDVEGQPIVMPGQRGILLCIFFHKNSPGIPVIRRSYFIKTVKPGIYIAQSNVQRWNIRPAPIVQSTKDDPVCLIII